MGIHSPEMKLYTSFAILAGLFAFSQACFVAVWTPNPAPAPAPSPPSPPAPSPPAPSPLVRSSNQDIAYLEWMSFDVCDENGDGGLTWQEVEDCINAYGAFINVDKLPSKEDFEHFDTNGDGTLYYDEWAEAQ